MFLRNFDMLSPKITLYYNKKGTHASIISGILTIIALTLIISFSIIYIIECINKENPTAYFFNRYIDDIGAFSFDNKRDKNFFNYIQIIKMRGRETIEIDLNKIEIIGINRTITNNFQDYIAQASYWLYGKCDNEIDISDIEYLIDNETFYKSACLKKFYNINTQQFYDINDKNFIWPSIEHGASNPYTTVFGVVIKKCVNTTFRQEHFEACSPENEINDYLDKIFLSFNIIDNYVDILNYKNPIKKYIYSITGGITQDSYSTNNLNFNPGLIVSYDDLFRDKAEEKITYLFHQNSKSTTILENTNIISCF